MNRFVVVEESVLGLLHIRFITRGKIIMDLEEKEFEPRTELEIMEKDSLHEEGVVEPLDRTVKIEVN